MNPGSFVEEGKGWRLALETSRQPFSVLIGGQDWASELTAAEALQLRDGIDALLQQLEAIADRLLEEETISLELERAPWWLCLDGNRVHWSLRFVLTPEPGQRAIEAGWLEQASAAISSALRRLPL